MANYIDNLTASQIAPWYKVFQRNLDKPLDRSSLFGSLEDAEKYILGDGSDSRGLGKTSYIGQVIAVYENSKVSVYVIDEDSTVACGKKLSPIGGTDTIIVDTYAEALKASQEAKVGQLIRLTTDSTYPAEGENQAKYSAGFYIVIAANNILSLSTSTGADDEIGALSNLITALTTRVDGIEEKINALYSGEELDVYKKSEVDGLLGDKVDKQTYGTDKTALEDSIKEKLDASFVTDTYTPKINEIETELGKKIDKSVVESTYATIKTVSGIQTELGNKIDAATVTTNYATKEEVSGGLSTKAEKTYVDDEIKNTKEGVYKYGIDKDESGLVYTLYQTEAFLSGEQQATKTTVGTINIPKDLMVTSGSVETATVEGQPYAEAKVGDAYIHLVIGLDDNQKDVYVPANKLVDIYTSNDNYIKVDGFKISLDFSTLANNLKTSGLLDGLATEKFVTDEIAESETTLKKYSDDNLAAANTYTDNKTSAAVGAAKKYTDDELLSKETSIKSFVESNYVKSEEYNEKIQALETIDSGYATRLTNLESLVSGGEAGESGTTLMEMVNTNAENITKIETVIGKEADGENTATGLIADIRDLENNTIKIVKIGDDVLSVTDNTVIIPIETNITATSNEKTIVTVAAVKEQVEAINLSIENAKTDSVNIITLDLEELPNVTDAKDNIIYITTDENNKHTEVIKINGEYHQIGSDIFVTWNDTVSAVTTLDENNNKVLNVAASKDGLMTATDKFKLDSIDAIPTSALNAIFESTTI